MTTAESRLYTPLVPNFHDASPSDEPSTALDAPDQRDGRVYVYDDRLKLAVEVALAAGRPLLLRGEPGSGKSSWAAYVARNLGWRYYEHVVTSRTQAQDLQWTFDLVRKLADAQGYRPAARQLYDYDYVKPGVLWWAFDRATALQRGVPDGRPAPTTPAEEPNAHVNASRSPHHAVVLLDEIDKADPDVPNGLLVPLGSTEFRVTETGTLVRQSDLGGADDIGHMSRHLVVITTNEERDLPTAFLRRCVVHELRHPDAETLVEIAQRHFRSYGTPLDESGIAVARAVGHYVQRARETGSAGEQRLPSTAEYLDAVRACRTLRIEVGSLAWTEIERMVLLKHAPSQGDGS